MVKKSTYSKETFENAEGSNVGGAGKDTRGMQHQHVMQLSYLAPYDILHTLG